jgi:hypothetical protein
MALFLNCTASAIPVACCGVSERIKKLIEFLTVEDSLQLAAGVFKKYYAFRHQKTGSPKMHDLQTQSSMILI